jgi:hypothetical protein
VSTALTAPTQDHFQACSGLMEGQAGHLAVLQQWMGDQCSSADGLKGLMTPLAQVVPRVTGPLTGKLAQCERGMHDVSDKVTRSAKGYAGDGEADLDAVSGVFPAPLPHFPDISALHLPQVGDFTDEEVTLAPPQSAKEATAENTKHSLEAMKVMLGNGPLALAEKAFRLFTGQDLVALLIHPLTGEYGQLKSLHDAYAELASGAYTVAATIRKGSWALADKWSGDAATGFNSHMFRWGMGIGGIGDAASLVARAFRDGYAAVMPLVDTALTAINSLIKRELRQLAELVAGDVASMLFGGPLNLVADAVALANTLFRVYETVKLIIEGSHSIQKIFHEISKVIKETHAAVEKVLHFASQPLQSVRELIDHLEQRGFSFEKNAIWRPELGVARMAMIPA